MDVNEIKLAVLDGKTVHWSNIGYVVIKDSKGQWMIQCKQNGHCIGLTWLDGVTLNGKEEDFFIVVEGTLTGRLSNNTPCSESIPRDGGES